MAWFVTTRRPAATHGSPAPRARCASPAFLAPGAALFLAPNANEHAIAVEATNGDAAARNGIGGVDARDHDADVFAGTIASATTPWFDNGIGQRPDVRALGLPACFAADAISDLITTRLRPNDPALFTGLSFSTTAAAGSIPVGSTGSGTAPTTVPEPASLPLPLAGGPLMAGPAGRRRA